MTDSSPVEVASAQVRHEWIDSLCQRLERMVLGDAASLLADESLDQGPFLSVLVAPIWVWRSSHIDIGRKDHRADGSRLLMPVRVTWSPSPVLIVTRGETTRLTWNLSGLGHSGEGHLELRLTDAGALQVVSGSGPDGSLPRVTNRLEPLVQDGTAARWEALMSLEGYVERAVRRAVTIVTADIFEGQNGQGTPGAVLDETSCEQVRDRMLLGNDQGRAAVDRLLDRCMQPRVFAAVDPLRYVTVDLQRTAEAEVRRDVQDPKVGRKVRTLRRQMPESTLDEFLAEYRRRHPGDALSWRRAQRALTSAADPMAGALDIEAVAGALAEETDLADHVAARLEMARRHRGAA